MKINSDHVIMSTYQLSPGSFRTCAKNIQAKPSCFVGLLIIAFLSLLNIVQAEDNLVKNPGFENITGHQPVDWRPSHSNEELKEQGIEDALDSQVFHSGDFSHNVSVPDSAPADSYGYYQDNIELKPSTNYRFSYWIKGKDVHDKIGASVILHECDENGEVVNQVIASQKARESFDWEKDEVAFRTAASTARIRICNTTASGTVWYDDFLLVEVLDTP